jgi:hypothetical protein
MTVPSSIQKFVGTWCEKDQCVEYSVSVQDGAVAVAGLDTSDGEVLRIEDISFDGSELRFTSICPSTDFALAHVFRSAVGDEIEHEFTRIEIWQRKKTP